MSPWRYKLDEPFKLVAPELEGVRFSNEWLLIQDSALRIEEGYAWDGCTPSWRLPGGFWVGIPNGPTVGDRPITWAATLVHDALCQFRPEIKGMTKKATVDLFRRMLIEAKAPSIICKLYPLAVDLFGPQNWS
jgi:hypothetical protein